MAHATPILKDTIFSIFVLFSFSHTVQGPAAFQTRGLEEDSKKTNVLGSEVGAKPAFRASVSVSLSLCDGLLCNICYLLMSINE